MDSKIVAITNGRMMVSAVSLKTVQGIDTGKPRLPQAAILHREIYNLTQQEEAIVQYNEIMQKFYESQQMNVVGDWVEHSVKRVATAQALNGRERLKEILQQLGFPLL